MPMTLLSQSLLMKIEKIELGETGNFSPIFLDYLQQKDQLRPFYHLYPSMENLGKQLRLKEFSKEKRAVLAKVLEEQYADIEVGTKVRDHISQLKSAKTFTITTGHQLNIFSGPLYFIYKIATVINTCKKLAEAFPEFNFVPVYWMASEDHDFEEINHFRLFGKTYTWETDQTGAVGRFDPVGLRNILSALPEKLALFEQAYLGHNNLADATRFFVNELFGSQGLVVVDADHPGLKAEIKGLMLDDLIKHQAESIVVPDSDRIEKMGYKSQVFCRPVNFFYLDNGIRERIVYQNGRYEINNTDLFFTKEEIQELVQTNPEKFSPNVILRPLYQETILPNLAYIGGPAEVAYWLQLHGLFRHYKIPFPVLMPRNFALIINRANAKKIGKTGVEPKSLFRDEQFLKERFITGNGGRKLTLEREKEILEQVFQSIKNQALTVDKSLGGFIGAEGNKVLKSVENIEKRLKKAEESKYENSLKSLLAVKEKLFPEGKLQERADNFLNFYINNPDFTDRILEAVDPFDFRFHILIEDE